MHCQPSCIVDFEEDESGSVAACPTLKIKIEIIKEFQCVEWLAEYRQTGMEIEGYNFCS